MQVRVYSKAEAGKLGALKSKIVIEQKKQERIVEYNKHSKTCKFCNTKLDYVNRKKFFCNHSCSAAYNNAQRVDLITWVCASCHKEHHSLPHRRKKYCNLKCQQNHAYEQKISNWNIETPGVGAIKRWLIETFGNKCSICEITEWNNKSIVFELEHKDGNSENNSQDNVCLICPNCHSQTDTYKGKNKGNGRFKRRQRYAEGKSY